DAGEAGRSEDERDRDRPTEQRGGRVHGGDVAKDARPEGGSGEGVAVGGQGALVLCPTVDVVEHAPGEATAGDAPKVGDASGPGQASGDEVALHGAEPEHRPKALEHLSPILRTTALLRGGTARPAAFSLAGPLTKARTGVRCCARSTQRSTLLKGFAICRDLPQPPPRPGRRQCVLPRHPDLS